MFDICRREGITVISVTDECELRKTAGIFYGLRAEGTVFCDPFFRFFMSRSPHPEKFQLGTVGTLSNGWYLLSLVIFFMAVGSYAEYRLAVISDPDGYTNVRQEPDPGSKAIFRFKDGDFFLCEAVKGSWWRVKDFFQNTGFIHNSRIRFYKDLPAKEKEPGH